MSGFQHRDNSGSLFKLTEDQRKGENGPGYEGEFKIICPHCNAPAAGWVKAWLKDGPKVGKYFSLAFKMKGRSQ